MKKICFILMLAQLTFAGNVKSAASMLDNLTEVAVVASIVSESYAEEYRQKVVELIYMATTNLLCADLINANKETSELARDLLEKRGDLKYCWRMLDNE